MNKIPSPDEMKEITIASARKRQEVELNSAVVKVSDVIQRRSKDGFGYVGVNDPEVQQVLAGYPFINWNKVAKVFRDAGYRLMTERNDIVWADAGEIEGK